MINSNITRQAGLAGLRNSSQIKKREVHKSENAEAPNLIETSSSDNSPSSRSQVSFDQIANNLVAHFKDTTKPQENKSANLAVVVANGIKLIANSYAEKIANKSLIKYQIIRSTSEELKQSGVPENKIEALLNIMLAAATDEDAYTRLQEAKEIKLIFNEENNCFQLDESDQLSKQISGSVDNLIFNLEIEGFEKTKRGEGAQKIFYEYKNIFTNTCYYYVELKDKGAIEREFGPDNMVNEHINNLEDKTLAREVKEFCSTLKHFGENTFARVSVAGLRLPAYSAANKEQKSKIKPAESGKSNFPNENFSKAADSCLQLIQGTRKLNIAGIDQRDGHLENSKVVARRTLESNTNAKVKVFDWGLAKLYPYQPDKIDKRSLNTLRYIAIGGKTIRKVSTMIYNATNKAKGIVGANKGANKHYPIEETLRAAGVKEESITKIMAVAKKEFEKLENMEAPTQKNVQRFVTLWSMELINTLHVEAKSAKLQLLKDELYYRINDRQGGINETKYTRIDKYCNKMSLADIDKHLNIICTAYIKDGAEPDYSHV